MHLFTDQTGKTITLKNIPQRIISLVPSQTELLFDLGLRDEVVGITKFCVHPEEWFRSKTRIGGTKTLSTAIIDSLIPDLIIANKEENVKEQVEELQSKYPVWTSDINTIEQAYEMMLQVGELVGKKDKAIELVSTIESGFNLLEKKQPMIPAAYLIWKDPWMTVGHDTFIHSMMEASGFENIFNQKNRYPEIAVTDLQALAPPLLLLSSEPFPFKEKHIEELQEHLPGTTILLVDGEMFSWYGSRMQQAPAYLAQLQKKIAAIL